MKRWEVLSTIARVIKAKRYLEIGVSHGESMRLTNAPSLREKWGIDPTPTPGGVAACDVFFRMTSLEFFQRYASLMSGSEVSTVSTPTLIFIDGHHAAETVLLEVANLLYLMPWRSKSVIAFHDTCPLTEEMQRPEPVYGDWTGDVWKAIARLRTNENGSHDIRTIDSDFGVSIMKPWTTHRIESQTLTDEELTWQTYQEKKRELLGIIDPNELEDWLLGDEP